MAASLRPGEAFEGRAVIVGARGFLGRAVVGRLQGAGIAVLPLSSAELDLTQPDAGDRLGAHARDGDTLVFLAALTPEHGRDSATLMRNLAMARAVVAVAAKRRLRQVVYASSDAVYPFMVEAISETTPPSPSDLYGVMHLARELILAAELKVPLAILRFTAIYGPGDTHNGYGPNRFIRQALEEKRIALFGEGEERRDHVWIGDAAAAVEQALRKAATGIVNVVSGSSVSFRSVAERIASSLPDVRIEISARKSAITHRQFDAGQLRRLCPDLRPTPIGEGLDAMIRGSDRDG